MKQRQPWEATDKLPKERSSLKIPPKLAHRATLGVSDAFGIPLQGSFAIRNPYRLISNRDYILPSGRCR